MERARKKREQVAGDRPNPPWNIQSLIRLPAFPNEAWEGWIRPSSLGSRAAQSYLAPTRSPTDSISHTHHCTRCVLLFPPQVYSDEINNPHVVGWRDKQKTHTHTQLVSCCVCLCVENETESCSSHYFHPNSAPFVSGNMQKNSPSGFLHIFFHIFQTKHERNSFQQEVMGHLSFFFFFLQVVRL